MSVITRKEIIEDEALKWGEQYVKMLDPAIAKNKEFVQSLILLYEANKKVRSSSNEKDYLENSRKSNEIADKSIEIWKEQIQLENALISTKRKNELATESTNKAVIKERTLLAETNKAIKEQVRNQLGLISTYDKLNKSRLEAQKRLADLLSSEQKNTKEIAKATIEFETLDARVKAVDEATKNYSKNIGNYQSAFSGLTGTLQDLIQAFGLVTGALTFGSILTDIFTIIREFDRQLIAVGKTANISGEDLKEFGRSVVELGGKLNGISITGLLNSAEVAGQLGVSGTENILKFSSAIEKLKLTSDIISDEQVGQFAKFIEVSQDSFENADRLASVITKLGNEMATTEAEVLANSTEIQKGVSVYNASAQSILGLGAATSTLGNEAEVSASSIQKGFGVINGAIATGKNLEQVLKLTGLTQKELSKQFNADASGTFVKFVAGLKKAKDEGENLQVILKSVELDEVRTFKTIGSLAANYEVLEKAMASAKQEYVDNVALNKEVAAASESIDSIISDLKDKWQEYILTSNDANEGTKRIATALKFLRDNLQSIISGIIKYGSVLLVFLGVQKAVTFATTAYTAIKTAAAAAQLRFALATGIGTQSVLAEATALRAATTAQQGMNIAMAATPWGIILAAIAAAVFAYKVFQDELSETEIRVNAVRNAQKTVEENEAFYSGERDKRRESEFRAIEEEIKLRKAKGENSNKLDKEEISRKIEVVESQLSLANVIKENEAERTKNQIEESNKRVAQLQKEFDETNKLALRNPFGESVKDKETKLINEKAELDALKATLKANSEVKINEEKKLQKIIDDLKKNNNVKDAEIQSEIDKKALAAARKRAKELYELEKKRLEDAYKLGQFRLQVAIDLDNEIINNEQASFEDRIDALLDYQQLSDAKIRESAEFELKNLGVYDDEKRRFIRELSDFQISEIIRTGSTSKKLTDAQQLIFERYQNGLTQIAKKGSKDRQSLIDNQTEIIKKQIDEELMVRETAMNKEIENQNKLLKSVIAVGEANKKNNEEDYSKAKINNSRKLMQQALEAENANNELIQNATEENERKIFEIKKKYAIEGLRLQANSLQKQLDENEIKVNDEIEGNEKSSSKIKEIKSNLQKALTEISDLELQKYKGNSEEKLNIEKEFSQKVQELAFQLKDELVNFANAIFSARISNIDSEIEANDEYYNRQIELAGNDARQKDILEKDRERKRLELEKKKRKAEYDAAVFNKIMSIATIATQTAMASIAALAPPPIGLGPVLGGSLLPFIIGVGAVQAATVLATPLPKYKDGRKGGPAEFAWTGDGGRSEVVSDPDGSNPRLTPKVPTLTYLKEGDVVHKSVDDYQKSIRASLLNEYDKSANDVKQYQILINNNASNSNLDNIIKKGIIDGFKKARNNVSITNKIDFGHEIWKMGNTNWNRK